MQIELSKTYAKSSNFFYFPMFFFSVRSIKKLLVLIKELCANIRTADGTKGSDGDDDDD